MKLTEKELVWIRNNLLSERMYRSTPIPLNVVLWDDWKELFLKKITDELDYE